MNGINNFYINETVYFATWGLDPAVVRGKIKEIVIKESSTTCKVEYLIGDECIFSQRSLETLFKNAEECAEYNEKMFCKGLRDSIKEFN